MEFILNHTLNDTRGAPDRWARPSSASYDAWGDRRRGDAGQPEFAHLSKVFGDDPGMRPRVWAPPAVNKESFGLMSADVDGAAPRSKVPPHRPRDTDPQKPIYLIPGHSKAPAAASTSRGPIAAASAAAGGSSCSPPGPAGDTSAPAGYPPRRSTLDVSDINAVPSVAERPHKWAPRPSAALSTTDINGAAAGTFMTGPQRVAAAAAAAGRQPAPRDGGLDVRDIAAPPRRHSAGSRGTSSGEPLLPTLFASAAVPAAAPCWQQQEPVARAPPPPPPPPFAWTVPSAVAEAAAAATAAHGGAAARRRGSSSSAEQVIIYAPPYATQIPGSGAAAALFASSDRSPAALAAAEAADHPAVAVGRPYAARRNAPLRHAAKRAAADAQHAAAAEAQALIARLEPSGREAVQAFWDTCRRMDREECGKLAPAEFQLALERAGVLPAAAAGGDGGAAAAAATLARGLADGSGLVPYGGLAGELMTRLSPGAQGAAPRRPAVAAGGAGSGGAGVRFSLSKSPSAADRPSTPRTQPTAAEAAPSPPPAAPSCQPDSAPALAASASLPMEPAAAPKLTSTSSAPRPSDWPPLPPPDHLQKRPAAAIGALTGMPPREAADAQLHPYKAAPYWFTGREHGASGAEGGAGGEAAGAEAEATEYVPSEDPTSFIVGKGHNRVNPVSGGGRTTQAESHGVATRRPYSAASGPSPTLLAASRLGLTGLLLGPQAAETAAATGPAGRSASAPRRAWSARAAPEMRVGRAALERQMHREEVAAVRGLY